MRLIPFALMLLVTLSAGSTNGGAVPALTSNANNNIQTDSISVAVPTLSKYSRKIMRVHRFLWAKWQRRQSATAEVTFFGMDAGAIYTVRIKTDSEGRWVVTEYVRHYQLPEREPEPETLVAEGVGLRRLRLRGGAYVVHLINKDGKTLPLFEYIQ